MHTDLFIMLSGTMLGYIAGLIPGIGNLVMLLMVYPLIMDATLFQMLLFYMALISSAQFSGSIVATVFGVPGDSSSLPAVIEGRKLFLKGQGNFAISNAALGSVLGSAIAIGIVLIVLPISVSLIKSFYNTNVQLSILLISTFSVIFLLGTSKLQNIWIFSIGFLLALIGQHDVPWFIFLPDILPYETFPKLLLGLPLFPVIVSLYVFPILITTASQFKNYETNILYKDNSPISDHFKEFYSNIRSALRGSFIGSLVGLIPHVGTIVASNLSYAFEKRLGLKKKTYKQDGDIQSLVSAETANNSTAMLSLMPLLLIGIPISSSEALLLSLIEMNSYVVNYTTTIETDLFIKLVYWFVAINIIACLLSWPAVRYVNLLQKINMKYIFWSTGIMLIGLVLYTGYIEMNTWYYFWVMACLAPIGYLLRNTEPLVLVIAFILQDKILASMSIFYQIHFG